MPNEEVHLYLAKTIASTHGDSELATTEEAFLINIRS